VIAIAIPSTFKAASFSMRLETNERAFASPYGGSEQVLDMGNDRWSASVILPAGPPEIAMRNGAFINALRGQTNICYLWHLAQPVPLGTMRGTPTAQAAAIGSQSLVLNSVAGATLLAGDMIGVSGLLLQVAEDATANGAGVMVVKVVNKLRLAVANGSAVTWNRPTAPFRKVSKPSFQHFFGYADGVSIDFIEAIG